MFFEINDHIFSNFFWRITVLGHNIPLSQNLGQQNPKRNSHIGQWAGEEVKMPDSKNRRSFDYVWEANNKPRHLKGLSHKIRLA